MIDPKEVAHALGYHAKAHHRAKVASDFAPYEYRSNIDLQLAFVAGWKEAIADDEVNRMSMSADAKYDSLVSAVGMLSRAMEELRRTVERQRAPSASMAGASGGHGIPNGASGGASGGGGGKGLWQQNVDMTFNPDGTVSIRGGGGAAGLPMGGSTSFGGGGGNLDAKGGGGGGGGHLPAGGTITGKHGTVKYEVGATRYDFIDEAVDQGTSITDAIEKWSTESERTKANEAMVEHYRRLQGAADKYALTEGDRQLVKEMAQTFAIKDYEVTVLPNQGCAIKDYNVEQVQRMVAARLGCEPSYKVEVLPSGDLEQGASSLRELTDEDRKKMNDHRYFDMIGKVSIS